MKRAFALVFSFLLITGFIAPMVGVGAVAAQETGGEPVETSNELIDIITGEDNSTEAGTENVASGLPDDAIDVSDDIEVNPPEGTVADVIVEEYNPGFASGTIYRVNIDRVQGSDQGRDMSLTFNNAPDASFDGAAENVVVRVDTPDSEYSFNQVFPPQTLSRSIVDVGATRNNGSVSIDVDYSNRYDDPVTVEVVGDPSSEIGSGIGGPTPPKEGVQVPEPPQATQATFDLNLRAFNEDLNTDEEQLTLENQQIIFREEFTSGSLSGDGTDFTIRELRYVSSEQQSFEFGQPNEDGDWPIYIEEIEVTTNNGTTETVPMRATIPGDKISLFDGTNGAEEIEITGFSNVEFQNVALENYDPRFDQPQDAFGDRPQIEIYPSSDADGELTSDPLLENGVEFSAELDNIENGLDGERRVELIAVEQGDGTRQFEQVLQLDSENTTVDSSSDPITFSEIRDQYPLSEETIGLLVTERPVDSNTTERRTIDSRLIQYTGDPLSTGSGLPESRQFQGEITGLDNPLIQEESYELTASDLGLSDQSGFWGEPSDPIPVELALVDDGGVVNWERVNVTGTPSSENYNGTFSISGDGNGNPVIEDGAYPASIVERVPSEAEAEDYVESRGSLPNSLNSLNETQRRDVYLIGSPQSIDYQFTRFQEDPGDSLYNISDPKSDLWETDLDVESPMVIGESYNATANELQYDLEAGEDISTNNFSLVVYDGDSPTVLTTNEASSSQLDDAFIQSFDMSGQVDSSIEEGVYPVALRDEDRGEWIDFQIRFFREPASLPSLPGEDSDLDATLDSGIQYNASDSFDPINAEITGGEANDTELELTLVDLNGDEVGVNDSLTGVDVVTGDTFTFNPGSASQVDPGVYNWVLREIPNEEPRLITSKTTSVVSDTTDNTNPTADFEASDLSIDPVLTEGQSYSATLQRLSNTTYENDTSVTVELQINGTSLSSQNHTLDGTPQDVDLSGTANLGLNTDVYQVNATIVSNNRSGENGQVAAQNIQYEATDNPGEIPNTGSDLDGSVSTDDVVEIKRDGGVTLSQLQGSIDNNLGSNRTVDYSVRIDGGETILSENGVTIEDGTSENFSRTDVQLGINETGLYDVILEADGEVVASTRFFAQQDPRDSAITGFVSPEKFALQSGEALNVDYTLQKLIGSQETVNYEIVANAESGQSEVVDNGSGAVGDGSVLNPSTTIEPDDSIGNTTFGELRGEVSIELRANGRSITSAPVFILSSGGITGITPFPPSENVEGTLDLDGDSTIIPDEDPSVIGRDIRADNQIQGDLVFGLYDQQSENFIKVSEETGVSIDGSPRSYQFQDLRWPGKQGPYLSLLLVEGPDGELRGLDAKTILLTEGFEFDPIGDLDIDTRTQFTEFVNVTVDSQTDTEVKQVSLTWNGSYGVSENYSDIDNIIAPQEEITEILNDSEYEFNKTIELVNETEGVIASREDTQIGNNTQNLQSPSDADGFDVKIDSYRVDYVYEIGGSEYEIPRNQSGALKNATSVIEVIDNSTLSNNQTDFRGAADPIRWEACDVTLARPGGEGETNTFRMDPAIEVVMKPNEVLVRDLSGNVTQETSYPYPATGSVDIETAGNDMILKPSSLEVPETEEQDGCIFVTDIGAGATLPTLIGGGDFNPQSGNVYYENTLIEADPFGRPTTLEEPGDNEVVSGFEIAPLTGTTVLEIQNLNRNVSGIFGETLSEFTINESDAEFDVRIVDLSPGREYVLFKDGEQIDRDVANNRGSIELREDSPTSGAEYSIIVEEQRGEGVQLPGTGDGGLLPSISLGTPALILIVVLAVLATVGGYFYFRRESDAGKIEWE